MPSFIFHASQSYFKFLLYPALLTGSSRAGLTLLYLFTCFDTLCTSSLASSVTPSGWADTLSLLLVRTGHATKPTSDQLCSWVSGSFWGKEAGESRARSSEGAASHHCATLTQSMLGKLKENVCEPVQDITRRVKQILFRTLASLPTGCLVLIAGSYRRSWARELACKRMKNQLRKTWKFFSIDHCI